MDLLKRILINCDELPQREKLFTKTPQLAIKSLIDTIKDKITTDIKKKILIIKNLTPYIDSVNFGNNHQDPDINPLIYCCHQGQFELVKFLVDEAGADINIISKNNTTPIMYAAEAGHYNIVEYLIGKGAALQIKPDNTLYTFLVLDDVRVKTMRETYENILELIKTKPNQELVQIINQKILLYSGKLTDSTPDPVQTQNLDLEKLSVHDKLKLINLLVSETQK